MDTASWDSSYIIPFQVWRTYFGHFFSYNNSVAYTLVNNWSVISIGAGFDTSIFVDKVGLAFSYLYWSNDVVTKLAYDSLVSFTGGSVSLVSNTNANHVNTYRTQLPRFRKIIFARGGPDVLVHFPNGLFDVRGRRMQNGTIHSASGVLLLDSRGCRP
jgi:hypothetical protein